MLTLGIDTSAVTASVALVDNGEVVADFSVTGALTHSEHLIPMIENCFEFSGRSMDEVALIAVDVGPGSFTGLRIGVATAKGLAFTKNVPCAPVSTLLALAKRASVEGSVICPVMDARRGEFYNAVFKCENSKLIRLTPDRAAAASVIQAQITGYNNVIICGDGAKKFNSLCGDKFTLARADLIRQNAAAVALIGEEMYKNSQCVTCARLDPVYLRQPQAEREYQQKNK